MHWRLVSSRRRIALAPSLTQRLSAAPSATLQRDDAEAAKLYDDFVKDFAVDNENGGGGGATGGQLDVQQQQQRLPQRSLQQPRGGPRPFVHGGTVRPGTHAPTGPQPEAPAPSSSAKKPGGRYVPSFMPPGMAAAAAAAAGGMDEGEAAPGLPAAQGGSQAAPAADDPVFRMPSSSGKGAGKARAIDALLENLKK